MNIGLSLRERVMATEMATNLLNTLPLPADGGDRILMLAALLSAERDIGVPTITLRDLLASHELCMSRLLGVGYSDFWEKVAEMVNERPELDEEGVDDDGS